MFAMFKIIISLSALFAIINGALISVADFGSNPSGLKMSIYVPSKISENPAVIVAVSISRFRHQDLI